jgi:hypothetical protein
MSVVASLVPGRSPQLVQIIVDEIPDGASWRLVGHVGEYTPGLAPGLDVLPGEDTVPADSVFTDGSYSWVVPGGTGVGDGDQVVLVDTRSPGNVPVVYRLEVDEVVESSEPVTVPFQNDIVLQTLDGQKAVDVELLAGSLDVELPTNVATFRVPGRPRPVVRYDVLSDVVSAFVVRVPMGLTSEFRAVIASGAPIVYRFGATSFDLDPVGVVALTSVQGDPYPTVEQRWWTLGYVLTDDPFADVRLGAFTWVDGFDAAFEGRPWTDLDEAFTGLEWDAFDTADWGSV